MAVRGLRSALEAISRGTRRHQAVHSLLQSRIEKKALELLARYDCVAQQLPGDRAGDALDDRTGSVRHVGGATKRATLISGSQRLDHGRDAESSEVDDSDSDRQGTGHHPRASRATVLPLLARGEFCHSTSRHPPPSVAMAARTLRLLAEVDVKVAALRERTLTKRESAMYSVLRVLNAVVLPMPAMVRVRWRFCGPPD